MCGVARVCSRLQVVLVGSMVAALLPLWFAETRAIALACVAAIVLLVFLVLEREAVCARLGWLGWRALVDAALVVPALTVSAALLLAH